MLQAISIQLVPIFLLAGQQAAISPQAKTSDIKTLVELQQWFKDDSQLVGGAIDLEATLTYFDGPWRTAYVEDGDTGVFLSIATSMMRGHKFEPGCRVRVKGTVKPTGYCVSDAVITKVADGQLPEPVRISFPQLTHQWEFSARYVETEGVVRQVLIAQNPPSVIVALHDGDVEFRAHSRATAAV